MTKQINKLKKLGMSSKEAMLFVHDIAELWYLIGKNDGVSEATGISTIPFESQFNKILSKPIKR